MKRSWYSVCAVSIAALLVLIAIDYFAGRISPPVNRREAEDGIRDLERSNPDILALGSSHARTLHVVGQELAARTQSRRTLVAVPLENGKLSVYDWTLQHRLRQLIEETRPDGTLVRDKLREFVLITEWWDDCAPAEKSRFNYWNLPSRAWALPDFLSDVVDNGLNGYNRNYLQNRARRTLSESSLFFDRTNGVLVERAMNMLQGRPVGRSPEAEQAQLEGWRRNVEAGVKCIGDPEQERALRNILSYAHGRGLNTTLLLFPRKPATLTEQAKATTLTAFAERMRKVASEEHARLVDLTTTSPLVDADFMEDFDHVNPAGNQKFAEWVLTHDLQFLVEPSGSQFSSAAGENQ
jgi:hypothetical protein